MSLMLSLPEDWDYTTRGLASICKDGVDSISTALKELEAEGYLARKRFRRKDGSLGRMEYVIYEHPACKLSESNNHEPQKPQKVKPVTESPDQEKPRYCQELCAKKIAGPVNEDQLARKASSNNASKCFMFIYFLLPH